LLIPAIEHFNPLLVQQEICYPQCGQQVVAARLLVRRLLGKLFYLEEGANKSQSFATLPNYAQSSNIGAN
jgi:hypothetical protein